MPRLEVKASLSVDTEGLIIGIASPFDTADRGGDIVRKGAYASARPPLPMLMGHDQSEVIGVWEELIEAPDGLRVKGRIVPEAARGPEALALIRAGAMRGLSIGYQAKRATKRAGGGRDLLAVDLMEISVVAVPMHPAAQITHAKAEGAGKGATMEDDDDGEVKPLTAAEVKAAVDAAIAPVVARIGKIEAKAARPGADPEPKKPEPGGMSVERKAFAAYLRYGDRAPADELKALNLSTEAQGGYLAPPELQTEIIRGLIEYSPIRDYASVRSTSVGKVIYPTRNDITNAAWHGELDTRTESSITFGQVEMETKQLSTFVELSNNLLQDAAQAEAEVRMALAEDFGKKEATAFLFGDGVLQPRGLMVKPGVVEVNNGHATDLKPDALITLLYSLPLPYRGAGVWVMNAQTLAAIRKLKDGDGRFLWQPAYTAGQPETILGRPVVEMVDMPAIAGGAFPIIYGDLSAYRVLDHAGMTTLVDPYTRAKNGITVIHATRRVGGDLLEPAKLRKLKMAA